MSKENKYKLIEKQIKSLVDGEENLVANLANTVAILHTEFSFWWTGFYFVADSSELVLGPFQGPVACTRIPFGKGVCGSSWKEEKTLVVEDVHQFPGHIACSSESNSEIVVPIFKKTDKDNKVVAVLDIDSKNFSEFDDIDAKYLERICALLSEFF